MAFYKTPVLVQFGVTAGFTAGVNTVVVNDWKGWEIRPDRLSQGPMKRDIDYSWDKVTGTWTLLTEGDIFNQNEYFDVSFQLAEGFVDAITDTGDYTNGFNRAKVINALLGRLGWRQPTVTGAPVLSAENLTSLSGRYFDGFHSLSNVMNIQSTMQDSAASDDTLNTLLQSLYKDVMMRCLTNVFFKPELIEQTMAYDRVKASVNQSIENTGKFAGYKIDVARDNHTSIQIHSVTLLFTENKTFNLYLFADGDPEPLVTKSVTCVANRPTIVQLDNLIFSYIMSNARNRTYFFGYFQNDLGTAKAIQEQACLTPSRMFCADPVLMDVSGGSPDYTQLGLPDLPYGLNLELSSFRDHTDVIIKNAYLFDEAIGLQMAYNVIEQIIYCVRSNSSERILKDQLDRVGIQLDLNGTAPISDAPQVTGLKQRIEREIKRIRETIYPKPKAVTVNYADC